MSVLGKCSKCGGVVEYSPEHKGLRCERCLSITTFNLDNKFELRSIDPTSNSDTKLRQQGVFKCLNCGASISSKNNNMSTGCEYCGANVIEELDFDRGLVPNAVFPFEISKEKAREGFASWIKGKSFVPNELKKNAKKYEIESMYVPVFEYDMHCASTYNARLYDLERDSDGDTVRKYRTVSGEIKTVFSDISIECSNYINNYRLNSLKPFWLDRLYKFDKSFLMGYSVEHPNTDVMTARDYAKKQNETKIDSSIVSKHNASGYDYINKEVAYNDIKLKYLLYPIYRLKVNHKGNTSYAYMNGQSGKRNGSLPISGLKVLLLVMGILGIIGVGLVLSLLIGGFF